MPHRLIASILTIASHSIASVNLHLHLLHLLVPLLNLAVFTHWLSTRATKATVSIHPSSKVWQLVYPTHLPPACTPTDI